MNHALTAMAIIVITVVAVAYVQRQSVLGVTRNFDNTGPCRPRVDEPVV